MEKENNLLSQLIVLTLTHWNNGEFVATTQDKKYFKKYCKISILAKFQSMGKGGGGVSHAVLCNFYMVTILSKPVPYRNNRSLEFFFLSLLTLETKQDEDVVFKSGDFVRDPARASRNTRKMIYYQQNLLNTFRGFNSLIINS